MQRALSGGWSGFVRPLVSDYVDRLAADIGSPPDLARAQALVQRLPLSVRIDGPALQWDSHPQRRAWHREPDDAQGDGGWLLSRTTRRRPPHRLRPGRQRLGEAAARHRLAHAGRAAAAHGRRLRLCAPPVPAAGRHPRRRAAFRPRRVRRADPAAPRRRAGRAGRAGQHHGARHPRHARRQARPAAGDQPRTALAADACAPERRTGGAPAHRATRCCATWA